MLTKSCVRGCGTRKASGCYLTCGTSIFGKPIEHFILDPMIPYPWEWQRGYKLFEKDGVTHVFIFVGESFYKSLWDYVEETKQFGASRHVADNFPFERLTAGQSKMVFLHRKGIPKFDFELDREAPLNGCKQAAVVMMEHGINYFDGNTVIPGYHLGLGKEAYPNNICTFSHKDLAYFLHSKKDMDTSMDIEVNGNVDVAKFPFMVNMPSFSYEGYKPIRLDIDPKEVKNSENWQIAAFLALPITHIEIPYRDNPKVRDNANQAGFDAFVTEW